MMDKTCRCDINDAISSRKKVVWYSSVLLCLFQGWWRAHHFIATFAGAINLIWPDGPVLRMYRDQVGLSTN